MRMIVSPQIEIPICWRITKVEGINPFGLMNITLYQDEFNQHTDVIEKDENGNWIAAWADLLAEDNLPSQLTPTPSPEEYGTYATISYAGAKPQIKVNGSYKAVTITYLNSNEVLKDQTPGEWSYWIDDIDASDLVKVLSQESSNTIKVKFIGDEEYLGKVLTVRNTKDNIVAELQLEIISL